MLTKIVVTLAVIVIVALIYRTKNNHPKSLNKVDEETKGVSSTTVAYTFLGAILFISGILFFFYWQDQNKIIEIKVTNNQGGVKTYKAHNKSFAGRQFITIDGFSVDLANSDRVEISPSK